MIPAPTDIRAIFDSDAWWEVTGELWPSRCDPDYCIAVEVVAFNDAGEPMIVLDGHPQLVRASDVDGYVMLHHVEAAA